MPQMPSRCVGTCEPLSALRSRRAVPEQRRVRASNKVDRVVLAVAFTPVGWLAIAACLIALNGRRHRVVLPLADSVSWDNRVSCDSSQEEAGQPGYYGSSAIRTRTTSLSSASVGS